MTFQRTAIVIAVLVLLPVPAGAGQDAPELMRIEPGTYWMGSDNKDYPEESPKHQVKITYQFWISKYEVMQSEYEAVMGANPSRFKGDRRPVETVSWEMAMAFCRKLTERERQKAGRSWNAEYEYRLPTEAEWEFCCRAGTTTEYHFGDELSKIGEHEWTRDDSQGKTQPVGSKKPNAWGLHDMGGNVREWCLDWWGPYSQQTQKDPTGPVDGTKHVYRGGDWFYRAEKQCCRSAHRFGHFPTYANYHVGFRVVLAPKLETIRKRKQQQRKRVDLLTKQLLAVDPKRRSQAEQQLRAMGEYGTLPQPITRMLETVPGASETLVWSKEARPTVATRYSDGKVSAVEMSPKSIAFGAHWPVRHVIDRVVVFLSRNGPDPKAFVVEAIDSASWEPITDGLELNAPAESNWIEYQFQPTACRQIRVRALREPPPVAEFEAYTYVPHMDAGKITWPERMVRANVLEKHILSQEEEPSFDNLSKHCLSMPAFAMMGLKDSPYEQAVSWSGEIVVYGKGRYRLAMGDPPISLAEVRDTVRRSLIDGWLPGVIVDGQIGPWQVRQTSFVAYADPQEEWPCVFIRVALEHGGVERPEEAAFDYRIAAGQNAAYQFRHGALMKQGAAALIVRRGNVLSHDPEGGIRFRVSAEADDPVIWELAIPLRACRTQEDVHRIQKRSYTDVLDGLKTYWERHLAHAITLELPELRLIHMHRAVLTQLLINAQGNIMPYGAFPSQYDGALYGHEEGLAMMALAYSGLLDDAQRYMSHTYLRKAFLRKVETYSEYRDRAQQVRNGQQPLYAIGLYQLSRDRQWMSQHVPLLKECAEWTIVNRKKTMDDTEAGERPLHWGLLPKWSYGGDVADLQCYALRNNLICCKALKETAWLLEELGDTETAARYRRVATEYRKVIDRVMDKIYRRDQDPPFLPLRVYGTTPAAGDYYQLLAGCLLDIQPFDFSGERVNWVMRHLEQDNRLFCGLPRFRRDVGPGGLDGIYGLGAILTKLHQDRIREFLLAFYAFQAFNMEHTCFTSRETNAIYASDLHQRTPFCVPDRSDPLPCSSAVALYLLRNMLLTEETEGAEGLSGRLLLLPGVPRRWFLPGQTIRVHDAPTHFGKVSFEVTSHVDQGWIEAKIHPPARTPYNGLKLRVRHPKGARISKVAVDGEPWTRIDRERDLILLAPASHSIRVKVDFKDARGGQHK